MGIYLCITYYQGVISDAYFFSPLKFWCWVHIPKSVSLSRGKRLATGNHVYETRISCRKYVYMQYEHNKQTFIFSSMYQQLGHYFGKWLMHFKAYLQCRKCLKTMQNCSQMNLNVDLFSKVLFPHFYFLIRGYFTMAW